MPSKSCQRSEAIAAYVDGEMTTEERVSFETHIAACPTCPAEVAMVRAALEAVQRAEVLEPSPDLRRRVLASLEGEKRSLSARLRALLRPGFLVPAGALALAALVAVVMTPPRGQATLDLALASNLELLEDYDVVCQLDLPPGTTADDLDAAMHLDELLE